MVGRRSVWIVGEYAAARGVCVLGLLVRTGLRRAGILDFFFFFQAEDGIRDIGVTGVQTCALPICPASQDVSKWLAGLDPARCAIGERTRADLERFQSELFAAADRFLWGNTSDVTYAEALPTSVPSSGDIITGMLHVGGCPSCGMALCLVLDESGAHLSPEPEREE